jgi:hypothetical protein
MNAASTKPAVAGGAVGALPSSDWKAMNAVLVMILCLAGSPERCETIRPAEWPAQVSLLECGVFGQHFVSDWLRLHPSYADYRLRAWRCETGERT